MLVTPQSGGNPYTSNHPYNSASYQIGQANRAGTTGYRPASEAYFRCHIVPISRSGGLVNIAIRPFRALNRHRHVQFTPWISNLSRIFSMPLRQKTTRFPQRILRYLNYCQDLKGITGQHHFSYSCVTGGEGSIFFIYESLSRCPRNRLFHGEIF